MERKKKERKIREAKWTTYFESIWKKNKNRFYDSHLVEYIYSKKSCKLPSSRDCYARSILWLEIYFFFVWRFLTRSMCSSTSVRFASREYVIMIGINFPFLRGGSSLVPHRSQWRRFVPRGCDSSTFVSSNLILVTFQMHFERM